MTSSLAKVNKSSVRTCSYLLMFLNIQIDLIILKTYDQQFTLTTKKSLHIIFKGVAAAGTVERKATQLPGASHGAAASASKVNFSQFSRLSARVTDLESRRRLNVPTDCLSPGPRHHKIPPD